MIMVLTEGEKVHVITRRLFDNDLRRHFVGEVKAVSDVAVRLEGYAFVLNIPATTDTKRGQSVACELSAWLIVETSSM
jgi:hypothetical protein